MTSRDHERDIVSLVIANVIEFQDYDISFPAVYAWMLLEVFSNHPPVTQALCGSPVSILLRILSVKLPIPLSLALLAGALSSVFAAISHSKFFQRLGLPTLRTALHDSNYTCTGGAIRTHSRLVLSEPGLADCRHARIVIRQGLEP